MQDYRRKRNQMNTTTKPTNITQLSTVRCGANHSGNHTLHRLTRGSWQCAGCGAMYTDAQVAAPGAGVIGSGGVIMDYHRAQAAWCAQRPSVGAYALYETYMQVYRTNEDAGRVRLRRATGSDRLAARPTPPAKDNTLYGEWV